MSAEAQINHAEANRYNKQVSDLQLQIEAAQRQPAGPDRDQLLEDLETEQRRARIALQQQLDLHAQATLAARKNAKELSEHLESLHAGILAEYEALESDIAAAVDHVLDSLPFFARIGARRERLRGQAAGLYRIHGQDVHNMLSLFTGEGLVCRYLVEAFAAAGIEYLVGALEPWVTITPSLSSMDRKSLPTLKAAHRAEASKVARTLANLKPSMKAPADPLELHRQIERLRKAREHADGERAMAQTKKIEAARGKRSVQRGADANLPLKRTPQGTVALNHEAADRMVAINAEVARAHGGTPIREDEGTEDSP
jgi:chemotaxis protein histidine kinase CheA